MIFAVSAVILLAVFLIPLGRPKLPGKRRTARYDERDIAFSRYRLKKGSRNYSEYYGKNSHLEESDARIRSLPGLMSSSARYHDNLDCSASRASFQVVESLRDRTTGEVGERTEILSSEEVLNYLTNWLRHSGADCVSAGKISELCWYSHVGRGAGEFGAKIVPEHDNAVVIGYRMNRSLVSSSPGTSEVVEVALRYSDCAVAAVQTACFLRNLGYSARAHIDGNYRVIAAEAARETGLGGFGWSSLLINGKFGPGVRYSVVTTDLPVSSAKMDKEPDFIPFCAECMKCVRNCPSRALSPEVPGSVDADRCFAYWNAVGTDCGVCVAVCPMGHPWGVLKKIAMKSFLGARLLILLDNVFYGKKHESRKGTEKWKR